MAAVWSLHEIFVLFFYFDLTKIHTKDESPLQINYTSADAPNAPDVASIPVPRRSPTISGRDALSRHSYSSLSDEPMMNSIRDIVVTDKTRTRTPDLQVTNAHVQIADHNQYSVSSEMIESAERFMNVSAVGDSNTENVVNNRSGVRDSPLSGATNRYGTAPGAMPQNGEEEFRQISPQNKADVEIQKSSTSRPWKYYYDGKHINHSNAKVTFVKAQGHKDSSKSSKPCHVGIH